MNYFRCGGSEKVTIDGEKVKDKLELVSQNVNYFALPDTFYFADRPTIAYRGELHALGGNDAKTHRKLVGTTWVDISTMPAYASSAVVFNDEIHIFNSGNKTHYKWDGVTWTQLSDIPYPAYIAPIVYNGKIHVFRSSSTTNHFEWDGENWSNVADVPATPARYSKSVVFNDMLHLFGSDNNGSSTSDHYTWNGTSWTKRNSLPYSFYYSSVAVVGNELHLFGGSYADNMSSTIIQNAHKHYVWDSSSWRLVGYLIMPITWTGHDYIAIAGIFGGSVVVFNDKIHVFGDYATSGYGYTVSKMHRVIDEKVYRT